LNPDSSEIIGSPYLLVNKNRIRFHKDDNPNKWDKIRIYFKNGKAKLDLLYYDAGKLKLQFAYDLDPFSPGYEMTTMDSNNEITFSPFGIFVDFQNIDAKNNNNISSFSTKLKAGYNAFIINAQGVCYDASDDKSPKDGIPDTNANLKDNKMPLKNFHANTKLLWKVSNPSNGSGSLNPSQINETDFKNGIGEIKATFSDVGILSINSVLSNDYIVSGNDVIGWPLYKYIGRFTPDHFSVTNKSNGILQEKCTSFNYTGDTITYLVPPSLKIIAQNKDNKTTQNYKNNFNFLTTGSITLDYPTEDDNQHGNSKELEINVVQSVASLNSNNDGTYNYTFGNDNITYIKNSNSKISPFSPQFSITISQIKDKDNIACNNLPQTLTVSGQKMKYGRVDILNNYGPETRNLKLKLKSYFWNNGNWMLNTDDSCTFFYKSDFILKNYTNNLNPGETKIINISQISKGNGRLTLSAPGKNNNGSVDVDFSSNSFLHDNNSLGKATFGLYRGRDRIIMWEEVPAK
jgi:MSHA biogenesis protein MshQ